MLSFNTYDSINKQSDATYCLNIEGCRPYSNLPINADWFNLIIAVDSPFLGDTFDVIMDKVKKNNFELIEKSIENFSVEKYICDLVNVINQIQNSNNYKNILIHVHQYENTTVLDKILEQKTGIKTILDKTNFYENPIVYSEMFPNIDCLISLSQCASLNQNILAGDFIVPQNFYYFDVKNNYVDLTPISHDNKIEKYLVDINYKISNVLMVNDLWSPNNILNDITTEGILFLDKEDISVLNFVKEKTKIFDDSHNWQHAIKVAYNSTKILNNKFVLYLALLHDVCDHKYPKAIKRSELSNFINAELLNYKIIDEFIDDVSFSKQKNFDKVDPILEAVRDGDRIEALGEIGLKRCEQIVNLRNGKIPDDVIKHCHEKLLRLLPESYISSEIGKNIALKHHNIIEEYVKKHELL